MKDYSSFYYSPVHNWMKKKFLENKHWENKAIGFITIGFVRTEF